MSDLKDAIKDSGLKMDLGLFEPIGFDPNCWNYCSFGCSEGCSLGCYFSGLSPSTAPK